MIDPTDPLLEQSAAMLLAADISRGPHGLISLTDHELAAKTAVAVHLAINIRAEVDSQTKEAAR